MLSAEPPQTPWDAHFSVLGFPVRIHPLFWLVGALLGFNGGKDAGIQLLIWFIAFFSSILIHELGHALMIRRFGRAAHIVLYAMGGLAIEGRPSGSFGSPWSFESYTGFQSRQRTPAEQILISAAGPGIQFVLLAVLVAGIVATGGAVEVVWNGLMPYLLPQLGGELGKNANLNLLLMRMLEINLYWPLINLLPVLPLDGGQIAMQLMTQQDPWAGTTRALWLSVIAAGAMAVFALSINQTWTMFLFASLAVSSYMTLQQIGGSGRPW